MGLVYFMLMIVFDIFGIVLGISDGYVLVFYLLVLVGVLFIVISYGKLVCQFLEVGLVYIYV